MTTRRVTITAVYPHAPETLFARALDLSDVVDTMAGLARYEGMPSEPVSEGKTYIIDVTFWGWLRTTGHIIHVERISADQLELQSREKNPSIRRWDHRLRIVPEIGGATWIDEIDIEAGWRTFFVAKFAAYVYRYRHRHRAASSVSIEVERLPT